ncbi:MAG: RNA polymerase sigma factor [Gemmatimonadaceae bacterium]
MTAHETRGSQAFPGVEGVAHSHIDRIAPHAAGRFHSLSRQAVRNSNSDAGATPGEAQSTSGSLSEAQLATFWSGIVANLDAARRMAARYVSKQSVDDVVNTAALKFVENAQHSKEPEPFPATPDRFRRKFLTMVRNHALKCIGNSKRPACPLHFHSDIDPEPVVGGRNVADRELDTVFARNDHGKYDAHAPTVQRATDDLNGLCYIIHSHMEDLSQTQREIIDEAYSKELPRDEIVARRGISPNTYDNHKKAAFRKLRDSMTAVAASTTDIDLRDWYDLIEEMSKRHAAKQQRRASRKKEKRSSAGGDRSKVEDDASNSRRDV